MVRSAGSRDHSKTSNMHIISYVIWKYEKAKDDDCQFKSCYVDVDIVSLLVATGYQYCTSSSVVGMVMAEAHLIGCHTVYFFILVMAK